MKPLKAKADAIMEANAHLLANPEEYEPIFSYDKCSIHTCDYTVEKLAELGIVEGQNTFPLPTNAADLHKVIEHVHANLTNGMQTVLWADRELRGMRFYKAQLRGMFEALSARSVQKDIDSLLATCEVIAGGKQQGGTEGDWAPAPYN